MNQTRPFNCHDQERPSWLDRAQRSVDLLRRVPAPAGRPLVVSDVGCGDMKLQPLLAGLPGPVEYRPYDLVPQSPAVAPLDIRRDPLPAPADVAVLLGVLEYVEDLAQVLRRLAGATRFLVVSHVVSDWSSYTPERLRELGWTNHLSRQEFGELLVRSGFAPLQEDVTANRRTALWLCRSAAEPTPA